MAEVTDHDRALARSVPDELLNWSGTPLDGLLDIVNNYWGPFDVRARCQLVGELLTALTPLLDNKTEVMDAYRDACEAIVTTWVARQ